MSEAFSNRLLRRFLFFFYNHYNLFLFICQEVFKKLLWRADLLDASLNRVRTTCFYPLLTLFIITYFGIKYNWQNAQDFAEIFVQSNILTKSRPARMCAGGQLYHSRRNLSSLLDKKNCTKFVSKLCAFCYLRGQDRTTLYFVPLTTKFNSRSGLVTSIPSAPISTSAF